MASSASPASGLLATSARAVAALREGARQLDPAAIREVAQQFEALFLREVLEDVRSAALAGDVLGSKGGDFYQEIFDAQLAAALSRGRGIGLGRMIEAQLLRRTPGGEAVAGPAPGATPGSALPGVPVSQAAQSVAAPHHVPPRPVASTVPPAESGAAGRNGRTAQPALAQGIAASAQEFVTSLLPHAQWAARELGIAPAAVIAQAALETAWGRRTPRHGDGQPSFNLFGIKAGDQWRGPRADVSTLEYVDGVAVRGRASFRAYPSLAEGVRDYVAVLKGSPRYRTALAAGANAREFVSALAQAGYATDPAYAGKLHAILASPLLRVIGP